MIKRVLKNKLKDLGYATTFVESKIKDFKTNIDFEKYTESELIQKIKVIVYDKPTAEIPRFFLNVKGELAEKFLFDGNLNLFTKFSSIGSQISLLDYAICENICIIGLTEKADILILMYMPSKETLSRYPGKTYEQLYSDDRDSIVNDYMEALTERLSNSKAKDILYVLLTEFVIDTILVENTNPKLKLYDNAYKFAENITNYEYKYINRRINRIEYVEKDVNIKMTGYGIKIGNISNNPYLLLKDVNKNPDFYLNRPTFAWLLLNDRGQEEVAIYTANESYSQNTYKEMVIAKSKFDLDETASKLTNYFSEEIGYAISKDYILSVLKKLNRELIIPPLDFIRSYTSENYDYIEPLRYRFSVMRDKKEFENMLYNSIDDNLNGRYRYRFVEKLSGIYMTIGNRLNYTDLNGKVIRKQSIADFNVNFNAAIVKRETLIDERSIPQLMGIMYKDIDNRGVDMLPVPSIEIVFYFPELSAIGKDVEMYNGTAIDIARGDGFTKFYEIGVEINSAQQNISKPTDPNEKYVVVKYINSDGETLKENIIRNVMIGSTFVPEIIPIINDREGKEWICEPNQLLNINVSIDNSKNEVEVKYIKKVAKVVINYINRQGEELRAPIIKNIQVGMLYDIESEKIFVDNNNIEWSLYQSKPARFIVSDDEKANYLTFVYDVIKADVIVTYKTRAGKDLKQIDKLSAVANKEFSPQIVEKIIDNDGLLWRYAQDSKSTIFVKENEVNVITLIYDELKKKVITKFVDENGKRIKDDIVEIIQVGKEIEISYEPIYIDTQNKRWKYRSANQDKIKVSENDQENIFIVTYEKVCASIYISFTNEYGQKIKDDLKEFAQIGSSYIPIAIKEIEDSEGKMWVCIEESKSIVIDENEIKNQVSFRYKPLMTSVYTQYLDIEGNHLVSQKEKEVQVGSIFVPELINSLQGEDQRSWIIANNNIKEYQVKKNKEENIIKINYDKKLVDINLVFKDIQGNILKDEVIEKAQLGAEYRTDAFHKLTTDKGEKWKLLRTEPAKMFVKEDSKFTLIYDEVKTKVIIKCVNMNDSKSIINDVEHITKLGGVYVPNIVNKIVDNQKLRWVYAGEPGMSIIANENEQDNIILLKYKPDKANITIRYLNKNQQMVHKDVVNAEQIGREVVIKEFKKIIEENGFGWKLKNINRNTLIVDEDENKNIVICNYEPLIVPVTTRYIDEDINEITGSKIDNVQVGTKFNATILPQITDTSGKLWVYSNIKTVELVVKDEENNKVNIKYIPLKKKVTEKFVNMSEETLCNDKISEVQVGETYIVKKNERIIDEEERSWVFKKSTCEKINVLEHEEKNIIINYYDKELTQVTIKYQNTDGVTLANDKILNLQIGSYYTIEPKKVLEDSNKLSWKLSEDNKLHIKIAKDLENNNFIVKYEPYMVNVYDKYINEATNKEIIPQSISKHQVGSEYLVAVKESIIDNNNLQWIHVSKSENKIFSSSYKVEPIVVNSEEAKNITIVKYKPKLAEVTIGYQDSLGNQIKNEEKISLQIGTKFSEKIPTKIMDSLGNKWTFNPHSNTNVIISENPRDNLIILAYEEQKGTVTFKYLDKVGNELKSDDKKLIQIGNVYTPQYDMILTDHNGCVWEYLERDKEKIEVKDNDRENIINLTYIPLNVDVKLTFIDLWGNEISENKNIPAQLGSKFTPNMSKIFTNENSLMYKFVKINPEFIKVKEIPITEKNNPNKFELTYEPINADVIIMFQDLDGNILKDEEHINLQVGSKYKPEPIEFIKDKKGNQWQLVSGKTDEITVFENEKENVIRYIYEVAQAEIIIRYISIDGLQLMPEKRLHKQVGNEYVPFPEEFIFDKENKKWKLFRVQPVNLRVGSFNNIVTITYQEEKALVTWQYCNEKGELLRPDEKHDIQIGARYTPIVSNKVIYDASQIWRLQKIEPYEIIISENASENIVKLIYSNAKIKEDKEEKKELVNPFANTEKEIDNKKEQVDNIINNQSDDIVIGEHTEKEEMPNKENSKIEKEIITENKKITSKNSEINIDKNIIDKNNLDNKKISANDKNTDDKKSFEFEDEYLRKLAKSMALKNEEKITINNLNNINTEIVKELRNSRNEYYQGKKVYDYSKAEELMLKEKEMIKMNLEKLIAKDVTGARLLKIFEHITASEENDKTFSKLQKRKAVLITDYFLDKPIEEIDKILYICERGKNIAEIELINKKIEDARIKNKQEYIELKSALYYEKLLLDNYYKARNNSNDNYFIDSTIKETTLPNIVIGVTNLLVKQALTNLGKDSLSLEQYNELEAIIELCTQQQIVSIKAEIEKFEGRRKRIASKLLQEILKKKDGSN